MRVPSPTTRATCLEKLFHPSWIPRHRPHPCALLLALVVHPPWPFYLLYSFFELIYSSMPRGEEGDHLIWRLTMSGVFDVRYFYKLLSSPNTDELPWEGIWCAKVPKRVSFFLWTTANDGILTIDNLVKRGQFLVNRCCLYYCDGESVDHLLLHCKFSHALWCETFAVFGIQWVMPKSVNSFFFMWRN